MCTNSQTAIPMQNNERISYIPSLKVSTVCESKQYRASFHPAFQKFLGFIAFQLTLHNISVQKSLTKDAISLFIQDVYFFMVNRALQFMRICLQEETTLSNVKV